MNTSGWKENAGVYNRLSIASKIFEFNSLNDMVTNQMYTQNIHQNIKSRHQIIVRD